MTAKASSADYIVWRDGTVAVMTEVIFPFYEAKAERELDRLCGGRLSSVSIVGEVATIVIDDVTETLVLDDIKGAICEIAEFLYQVEQLRALGLVSFSNDGQSGSYDQSKLTAAGRQKEIRMIAKSYLAGTVLLHAGVTDLWHG